MGGGAAVNDKILLPNSFQTPNALVDKAMPIVSGPAFKLLIAITRLTLGWNHTGAVQISLDGLCKRTRLSRQGTVDGLKELKKLELVIIKKGARNSRTPNEYALNLDLTTGELVKNIDRSKLLTGPTSPQGRPKLVHNSDSLKPILNPKEKEPAESDKPIPNSLSANNPKSGVDEQLLTEPSNALPNNAKRRRTRPPAIPTELQPIVSRVVSRINELSGKHYEDDKPKPLKNLIHQILDNAASQDACLAVVEGQWEEWRDNPKMIKYYRPSTLFSDEHFDDYLQNARRAASNGNGRAKPKCVKRLENGNYDVDGAIIDEPTYNDRYGHTTH